tara:strand:- start:181 stop:726 length:546 start_codon:yes stop_codon:yes gene_type:complete
MNICHTHKFILWALPRTAARYTHTVLRTLGSMPPLTHRIGIPAGGEDYDIICTVRNPYIRALSVWKWQNAIKKNRCCHDNFPEFMRQHHDAGGINPISKDLGSLRKTVKYLIHVESIEEDLRSLPYISKDYVFPKNNFRSNYHGHNPQTLYDEESQEHVRRLYAGDFIEFGYDSEEIPKTF